MTEDVIKCYDIFNTKGCQNELLFGKILDQPIPPNYYDLLNDDNDDDNENNIPGTPVADFLPDN